MENNWEERNKNLSQQLTREWLAKLGPKKIARLSTKTDAYSASATLALRVFPEIFKNAHIRRMQNGAVLSATRDEADRVAEKRGMGIN